MAKNPMDAYVPLIGAVTVHYNGAQAVLFKIFQALLNVPEEQSAAIFFAIRSDREQRNVVSAFIGIALSKNPKLRKKINGAIAELNGLAGRRNDAIHALWETDYIKQEVSVLAADGHTLKGKNITKVLIELNIEIMRLEIKLYDLFSKVNDLPEVKNRRLVEALQKSGGLLGVGSRGFLGGLNPPGPAQESQ